MEILACGSFTDTEGSTQHTVCSGSYLLSVFFNEIYLHVNRWQLEHFEYARGFRELRKCYEWL